MRELGEAERLRLAKERFLLLFALAECRREIRFWELAVQTEGVGTDRLQVLYLVEADAELELEQLELAMVEKGLALPEEGWVLLQRSYWEGVDAVG